MVLAIGLMSGTSMDGIDAALLRTDGDRLVEPLGFLSVPYEDDLRDQLRGCLGGRADADVISGVERALTDAHAGVVQALLRQVGAGAGDVDLIGFHGHTIHHAPHDRRTWQIGDGARLAALTGIDVVNDFRTDDVLAGGQGAPLVPLYHRALAAGLARPLAILNLGGVGNVTWIDADCPTVGFDGAAVIACDTGPANALIDDWVWRKGAGRFDDRGHIAAAGKVDDQILGILMDHPYFAMPAPKSLDRDAFDPAPVQGLSLSDGAATLTAFTARSVAAVMPRLPVAPGAWLVTGGGRHNTTLMAMLADLLQVPVDPVELVGWDGDGLEAQAFAYLAVRSRLGLALSLPGTTGVPRPLTGGRFCPAPARAA